MNVGELKQHLENVPDDYELIKDGKKASGIAIMTAVDAYDHNGGGVEVV